MNAETPALVVGLDRALAYHDQLRATVARLDAAFASRDLTPRLSAPWRHFTEGIVDHMKIEEEILFPALRAIALGQDPGDADFDTPLHEMQNELDELNTILDALRSAAPEAADLELDLLTMLDELEEHARKEEQILQPAAVAMVAAWRGDGAAPAEEVAEEEPPHHTYHARPTHPPPGFGGHGAPLPGSGDGLLFRVFRRVLRAGLERLDKD